MTSDDLPTYAKAKPIDLEVFSIEELHERIIHLEGEIERAKSMIISKKASLNTANALFGGPKT